MRIDAHQHYWKVERGDYGWLTPAAGILYRDYLPQDLAPHLKEAGIDRTIVVQAAPTVEETYFLLDLAEENQSIAGVVGWLDMEADDFASRLEQMLKRPKFVGLRPMIQDIPDDDWMLRPNVRKAFTAIEESGCVFDFLTFPRHLPRVLRILESHPKLRCVIDHLSKPPIKEQKLEPWRSDIARVAEFPNVACKLSGMVTEADHRHWKPSDLEPYVRHVVDIFGWERVLFGSDWPVCLLAAEYGEVVAALREALGDLLDEGRERLLFGANAARVYGLDRHIA